MQFFTSIGAPEVYIHHTTHEASPEQVSGPGGVYASGGKLGYSTLGTEGTQHGYTTDVHDVWTPDMYEKGKRRLTLGPTTLVLHD